MKNPYNLIAPVYDFFTARFYRKMRRKLIECLDIRGGDRILVVACGTGQSFQYLTKKTGRNGSIIAFDYSDEMLKRAKKKIGRNGWTNIRLFKWDARLLNKIFLEKQGIDAGFDVVLAELALSVIPEWQKVLKESISLLNENGKIGLLDWYLQKQNFLSRTLDFLARAETSRNTIDYTRSLTGDFEIIDRFFFKSVYIAVGIKGNSAKSVSKSCPH